MAPITKAQAERERISAEKDIKGDGARVTILYDGRQVDAATGAKAGPAPRSIKTWALLGSFRASLVDGKRVVVGDSMVTVADRSLGALSLQPLIALDGDAPSGYWLYLPADPEKWAEATDPPTAGDRRLQIVRLVDTVPIGGYPLLRVLQCRG